MNNQEHKKLIENNRNLLETIENLQRETITKTEALKSEI
jgi:hypothetical protein